MDLLGYSDRLSAGPGDEIRFMVSSAHPTYRADLVRLIHGDLDPRGPGFKADDIPAPFAGDYPGVIQPIPTGSCVVVPADPRLAPEAGVTIQAWLMPTLRTGERQTVFGRWSHAANAGYDLALDADGLLVFRVGDGAGHVETVTSGAPIRFGAWSFIAASFDAATGRIAVDHHPIEGWPREPEAARAERTTALRGIGAAEAPLVMAAAWRGDGDGPAAFGEHFNGKIDRPRLFGRALAVEEMAGLAAGDDPASIAGAVAIWDFAQDMATSRVVDASPNALHGRTINRPARAMTGANWRGDEMRAAARPAEYGAIHFHDDDLDDAGWVSDFAYTVPDDLASGVYAARLRAGDDEDYVPFVVRPRLGRANAPIAYLMPTFTYLAYADEHMPIAPPDIFPFLDNSLNARELAYLERHRLNSLYDTHRDGSGVCYVSWRRPLLNMRPSLPFRGFSAAEHFAADLYLIDWMEAKGYRYDVIADENLHTDGQALLAPYRVVVTGTHPEYWTAPMLDSLQAYLDDGGRVMYLGGNGFYWVTAVDPELPHLIEVRRWGGTGTWRAKPGEFHLSTTGEMGGLWRNRNRAPQKMLGVGFTAQGFDYSRPYRRLPDSFDPRAAFIFEGIGPDEVIGDFPALTLRHGVAGYEIDRADEALGTPAHALVMATATGFSDSYQHVIEEVTATDGAQGGTREPLVRADIVLFETANGGAVFSVGSIAWCGGLSHNDYDNNVSRLTGNVLTRFMRDEPL